MEENSPKESQPIAKKVEGKYHWCTNYQAWVLYSNEQCKNKPSVNREDIVYEKNNKSSSTKSCCSRIKFRKRITLQTNAQDILNY